MSAPHVLTIDLGTSGLKAAVVSSDGHVVGRGHRSVVTSFTPDGGAEQDPEQVWRLTLDGCRDALGEAGDAAGSVTAVIASSQYSSIIPVDAAGRHVAPMMVWMDQRGAPGRVAKLPGAPRRDGPVALARWLWIHGLPPIEAGMSLTHMRWIRYARPDVYERTTAFLEPMDYLTLRFSGRAVANRCSAHLSLLTDNRAGGVDGYHPTLVEQSHIDADKLPELVPVGAEVGPVLPDVADALGLDRSTRVLSGFNDTQAGAIAVGAFTGTHAGVSIGTTGVIVTHVPKKKTSPLTSIFTVPSPIGDGHLVSAENGVAGVGLDYFLSTVVYGEDAFRTHDPDHDRYEAFNDAASAAPAGASGVLFLPWLRGSLAPTADGRVRGGFLNVGLDNDRNDLARAVLEGIALNFRRLRDPVQRFTKRDFSHYLVYGGGARSDLWSQILADVLGAPVHRLEDPSHANSLGAGLFALERIGAIGLDDVVRLPRIGAVFDPDTTVTGRYDELAGHFVKAFKRNRPLFHDLNPR